MRLVTNTASPCDFPGSDPPEPQLQASNGSAEGPPPERRSPAPQPGSRAPPAALRREKASPALMLHSLSDPGRPRG